jgi:hypothetical protein
MGHSQLRGRKLPAFRLGGEKYNTGWRRELPKLTDLPTPLGGVTMDESGGGALDQGRVRDGDSQR